MWDCQRPFRSRQPGTAGETPASSGMQPPGAQSAAAPAGSSACSPSPWAFSLIAYARASPTSSSTMGGVSWRWRGLCRSPLKFRCSCR
eukprot:12371220-Alexandrium_andersonii.AAC.1